MYPDIHTCLFYGHRNLLFPAKKLQTGRGTWLCQMGRRAPDLQKICRQGIYPQSAPDPELPHEPGGLPSPEELKRPGGGRLRGTRDNSDTARERRKYTGFGGIVLFKTRR